MTKSKIFLFFCLSFIAGIFINSIVSVPQLIMLGVLILGILLISVFRDSNPVRGSAPNRARKTTVLGFCFLFLITGAWRHQSAWLRIENSELRRYGDLDKEVVLVGRVVKESAIRENNIKLTVKPDRVYFPTLKYGSKERILVTTERYPEYEYGDELKIRGRLQTPITFEDFNYRDYLAKDGISVVVYWPKIEVLAKSQGNFLYAKILYLKNRLSQNIKSCLSPPFSSLLSGILLGEQSKMSKELKEQLNRAGLRHITAVSGMHVAILTNILLALLLGLGFGRRQAFYCTIILIALFIVLIGLQPSAVRAGIMGGFLLLAQHLGRLASSSRAMIFAAALMLLHNPLLLRLDIGFQLSFLAVMGIIYFGPLFQSLLSFLPKEKLISLHSVKSPPKFSLRKLRRGVALPQFNWVKDILTMTFSAYLATLPLLLYNFGTISLLAPLSNVLVLPFLPWLMVLGFVMALLALIWLPLAWLFSLPLWLLLSYVIKLIVGLSSFSFSSLALKISWPWLLGSYIALGFFAFWIAKRYRRTPLGRIN